MKESIRGGVKFCETVGSGVLDQRSETAGQDTRRMESDKFIFSEGALVALVNATRSNNSEDLSLLGTNLCPGFVQDLSHAVWSLEDVGGCHRLA